VGLTLTRIRALRSRLSEIPVQVCVCGSNDYSEGKKSLDVVVQVDPLSDVEKFLDCQMRPSTVSSAATGGGGEDASDPNPTPKDLVKHYLIKWKSMSYLHCSW